MGVGGFLFQSGGRSLMSAPSFTHPGLLHVFFGFSIAPDSALIARRIALLDSAGVRDARAILVGHGHYDHLLDVPIVARAFAPRATIYGGPTVANILAGAALEPGRVQVIERSNTGGPVAPGTWYYLDGGRFRFMALWSEHPPNFGGVTFAAGRTLEPRSELPRSAWGYKLGEPYAYLIDVIRSDSTPALRVLFHDAAVGPERAPLPPFESRDTRPIDVFIVTAGNFDAVQDYPTAHLTALQPRRVIVAHWESFFRSPERPLRAIPLLHSQLLAKRLEDAAPGRWVTPEPMAKITIAY
jgi:hypothetical protein